METLRVEILNPKAKILLKGLADLKLINIKTPKTPEKNFVKLLKRLRSKAETAPSLEEITKEVEFVRQKRYAK